MAYQLLVHSYKAPMPSGDFTGPNAGLRLILVGKSGGGKSATGNTILGRKEFKSTVAAKTTTLKCERGWARWQGQMVYVVDTPALFDSDNYSESARQEIMACINLSQPGPHALILVTQVGRFTAEDATATKCVRDIFGAESTLHTIVLFTCVEDLGGTPLQEYVMQSDNQNLRELIWECRNRFCGFNNRAAGAEREGQVSELLQMVQSTVSQNGGRYYVNRLYLEHNLTEGIVQFFVVENRKARKAAENWKENAVVTAILILCFVVFIYIIVELS